MARSAKWRTLLTVTLSALVFATLVSLGAPGAAHAETCTSYTWGKTPKTSQWSNPANWTPAGVPGATSDCDSVSLHEFYDPETKANEIPDVVGVPAGTQLDNLSTEEVVELSACPTEHESDVDCKGGVTVHGNFLWSLSNEAALVSLVDLPITVDGESTLIEDGDLHNGLRLEQGGRLTFNGPAQLMGGRLFTPSEDEHSLVSITNNSTLSVDPGSTIIATCCRSRGVIANHGSLVVPASSSGVATLYAPELDDKGSISVGAGSTLAIEGPSRLAPGVSITGAGRVLDKGTGEGEGMALANGVTIGKGTTLQLGEGLEGGAFEGSGSFVGEGSFRWTGDSAIYGSLNVGKSITTTISGPEEAEKKGLQEGTLTLAGSTSLSGKGALDMLSAHIVNEGALTLGTDSLILASTGSTFQQAAGSTTLEGATLESTDPVTVTGGSLSGHGTVDAPLVNSGGTVHPSHTGGVLEVLGTYEQTPSGTLQVEIEGTSPGSGFGQLDVSEAATLAGTLSVETGAFNPRGGRCYPVLPYSSESGSFAPLLGGSSYTVEYPFVGPAYVAFGLCVATSELPEGTRGEPYTPTQLVALDGKAPYKWKKVGTLPKKLKLSKSGVLSGTPSTKIAAGTYPITVEVKDAAKQTAKVTLALKLS